MKPEHAAMPVSIARQADGRHHVIAADGSVLGKHNSPWSAARQMHDYYQSTSSEGAGGTDPAVEQAREGTEAAVQKPNIPHPSKKHPAIPRPEIKRP
jgi:hypothetical protein